MSDTAVAATLTPAGGSSSTPKATSVAGQEPAAPATQTTTEKVVETVRRYIPGLGGREAEPQTAKPTAKRSRSSKTNKKTGAIASADDPALATAELSEAPEKSQLPDSLLAPAQKDRPAGLNGTTGLTEQELAELQHKRFSPALAIQKRLRANNKKLQRVVAYEQETGSLNADQKKALATKPALEAVTRELSEIIKQFETDELDEEKRSAKKQQYEEKQIQFRINQALANSKVSSQTDLTLLLQFLHLYSLFNPSQSFAPPTLPPVVANATGQQHAAVHTLFNNLANGPLFGAAAGAESDDAVSQIKALQDGSSREILEGVSFADIKQMIFDLTAPPAEVGHEIPASEDQQEQHTSAPGDNLPVTGQAPIASTAGDASAPSFNFMQASELGQGSVPRETDVEAINVSNDAPEHQRALETVSGAATPGFGSGTPVLERSSALDTASAHPQTTSEHPSATGNGWNPPENQLAAGNLPTTDAWGDVAGSAPIQNWADEVEENQTSNPFTTTADIPSELVGAEGDVLPPRIEGEAQRSNYRGRGRGGRGRGGNGGEYRGRGRGGPYRGGSHHEGGGDWRNRSSNEAPPTSAVTAALSAAGDGFTDVARSRGTRGGPRGGNSGATGRGEYRGRGRGEGRGRGGPRSGPNTPTTPAAPAA